MGDRHRKPLYTSPCTPDITLGAVAEKPGVVDRKMENREYLSTDERLSLTGYSPEREADGEPKLRLRVRRGISRYRSWR